MKWLRYCIVMLSFMLLSPASLAGEDPIGWSASGGIPSQTVANVVYPTITYTFINNLPFQMVSPLYITKYPNPGSDFSFPVDTCSGVKLLPGQTCIVTINYFFASPGKKTVSLAEEYGRNVVPLPKLSTTTGSGPSPLVTGTVTIPLPATMGADEQQPFQFTYTNNNNGTVIDVSSSAVTINPNAGGGTIIGTPTDTCATLPGAQLTPGESCTVTGVFQSGVVGQYTLNHHLTYLGGTTSLSTSTNAIVEVTGVATTPLPTTMGAGEEQPFVFTFTNNGTGPVLLGSVTLTDTGGTNTGVTDLCSGTTLAAHGGSCTVSGTFESGLPGSYKVTATLASPGPVVVSTTSTGTVLVTGVATTPLPANMGAGEAQSVVFTFTNNGTGTIYGITPPSNNAVGGTFTAVGGSCTSITTLGPSDTCTYSGTFTSGPPGTYSVTASFNYAGGTGVAATTTPSPPGTSTVLVTGTATTPLPNPMGSGEEQPFVFTFTNTGSGTATGLTAVTFMASGGTLTGTSSTCSTTLAAGASCTASGTFNSGAAGSYSVTATLTYAGGTVAPTTTSTGSILVAGIISPGLPASIGTGEQHEVAITYTNNGSGTAYGITDPTSTENLVASGGTCTTSSSTCGSTLGAGSGCTVLCDFQTNVPGTSSVSSSLTYAGGTTPAVTTTSTATMKVITTTPSPLPSSSVMGDVYTVQFAFTNNGSASVSGASPTPPVVVSPGPSSQLGTPTYSSGCTAILGSGDTCLVTVMFTPSATATAYIVSSTYTYTGGLLTASTTTTTAAFRTFTINNYCSTDVWYAFNGAPVRKGCSNKNPCPKGSMCNPAADSGAGVCYWKNPLPTKGDVHLGPMTGTMPTTSKVLVSDMNPANTTLWSGSFAGRTGCDGSKACETADCNSGGGNKACPPGNAFTLPATTAQFTLMRNAEDTYSVQAGNGINLSLSMGPTDPTKTTPAYRASTPFYCAIPGSANASNIFSACSWIIKPPAYPDAGSAVDYVWVKPGMGGACPANVCPSSEVCGLSFTDGKFAQVCGRQLGYWTASQACLLNTSSARAYFDCNTAMAQPAGDVLKDLNACTNVSPQGGIGNQPQACVGSGNAERATMVQWIKSACPSVSAFAGDSANSTFTCTTNKPSGKAKTNTKINVTDYTISFCPEQAPSSPFRQVQRK